MVEMFYSTPADKTGHAREKDGYHHTHSSGWSHVILFFYFLFPHSTSTENSSHDNPIEARRCFAYFQRGPHFYIPLLSPLFSDANLLVSLLFSQYGSASGAQARLSMMSCSSHPNETFLYSETKILFFFRLT